MTEEPKKLGWEQQVISKVAQVAIARVLEAERIAIQIDTTLGKVMRGEIDAMSIGLQQFFVRQQFIVDHLQLHIGRILVSPRDARRGNILLQQPTTGRLELRLTEQQLTQVLQEDFRQYLIENSSSKDHDLSVELLIDTLNCVLQDDNVCVIQMAWKDGTESLQTTQFCLIPTSTAHAPIVETLIQSRTGRDLPEQVINTVCLLMRNLLNLQDFGDRGTQFILRSIQTTSGLLILNADAEIFEFPTK